MQLQLDSQALKALSSKSRIDILKLLAQRQYLQSELAKLLNLSVPTVKEHLTALEKAFLVERHDEGRKWKYYSLTKKGKAVLQPQETTILLVLGLFIFSMLGGTITLLKTFFGAQAPVVAEQAMAKTASLEMSAPIDETASLSASTPHLWPLYFFGIATVVFAVLFVALLYKHFARKRQLGRSLTKKQDIY